MTGTVCVFGLWHLGSVTSACLASRGLRVVGLDFDAGVVQELSATRPPLSEPGLPELVAEGVQSGRLNFSSDARTALADASVLWVTFDTPTDENDEPDPGYVRAALEKVRAHVRPGTLVIVSSQVPVGFTRALEQEWRQSDASLQFACIPENLQLGRALESFLHPARLVVGLGQETERASMDEALLGPGVPVEWMRLESAEMTKHALNAFLAVSAAYANELGRVCETVGADAQEVERGLRTDPRVGTRAYVRASGPIAGATLLRDIHFLEHIAADRAVDVPVIAAVDPSNRVHEGWVVEQVRRLVEPQPRPVLAVLGLTYKPDTDTLRGSAAVPLIEAFLREGVRVRVFDPLVKALPTRLESAEATNTVEAALEGADVAVVMTPWPQFRDLSANTFVERMRHCSIVDQAGFLAHLGTDPRLQYIRVGAPTTLPVPA